MSNIPKQDMKKFLATVTDDNFAFEVITELAKAFRRAKERNTQVHIS